MQQTNRVGLEAGRRILVVDDVETNRRLVDGYLRREGYQVLLAANGEDALRSIRHEEPDLVLLDVLMPGMDGFEICRRIRSNPAIRHIPVILVTSLNKLDHKVQGQEAGADDFVAKPFDSLELLTRVRSMLRIKALHDQLSKKIAELESAKIRLRRLADTDPLTSLYNKRYFIENLRAEFNRAERYGNPFSLVILDVDNFKAVNDRFGHPTGDVVLQQVATLLVQNVRKIDLVARVGGEEFAVVLPETRERGGEIIAERLCRQIERHCFVDADGEPLNSLTISAGVAAHAPDVTAAEVLIKLADTRLYEAKQRGRNCFVGATSSLVRQGD